MKRDGIGFRWREEAVATSPFNSVVPERAQSGGRFSRWKRWPQPPVEDYRLSTGGLDPRDLIPGDELCTDSTSEVNARFIEFEMPNAMSKDRSQYDRGADRKRGVKRQSQKQTHAYERSRDERDGDEPSKRAGPDVARILDSSCRSDEDGAHASMDNTCA